jgi:hypothetical protein
MQHHGIRDGQKFFALLMILWSQTHLILAHLLVVVVLLHGVYPEIDSGYVVFSQEVGRVVNCTCRVYYRYSLYASADNWAYCGVHILCKVNDQDYFDRWPGEWAETLRVIDNTEYHVLLEWVKWEKVFSPIDTVKGIAFCTEQCTDTLNGTASVSFYIDDVYISGTRIGIEGKIKEKDKIFTIYPNPFVYSTTIIYYLSTKSEVSLRIYDVAGRKVKLLVNEEKLAGYYKVNWDAKDLAGGIYFVRLETGDYKEVKKLILVR